MATKMKLHRSVCFNHYHLNVGDILSDYIRRRILLYVSKAVGVSFKAASFDLQIKSVESFIL